MRNRLPILLLAVSCCLAASWAYTAPPIVLGNRTDNLLLPAAKTPRSTIEVAQAPADSKDLADSKEPSQVDRSDNEKKTITAKVVLQETRKRLKAYDTVQTDIIEIIRIGDYSFKATGRYLRSTNNRHRLELELQLGETTGTFLEVCDGQVLYTRKQISDETSLTRRNVEDIMRAAENRNQKFKNALITDLGLGGLSGLLAAIQQSMVFDVLRDETIDGHSVFMVQGSWNDEYRKLFLQEQPKAKGRDDDQSAVMSPLVPDSVRIYLTKQEGFPLRIEYLKRLPNREVQRPMLIVHFSNFQLKAPVDESEFEFVLPPEAPLPTDLTPLYLGQLAPLQQDAPATASPAQDQSPSETTEGQ